MAVSPGFAHFVVEQLEGCGPITATRMFGGVGLYAGDVCFAFIDNDVLYLKTGDANRADFVRAGEGPFRPAGDGGATMPYYSVPVSVLEDAGELAAWGRRAIAVAVAAKSAKARRARPEG